MEKTAQLPDEEVKIRIGKCFKCKKILLTAVEHMMSKDGKKQIADIAKDGGDISTMSLIDFRAAAETLDYCDREICYPKVKKGKKS